MKLYLDNEDKLEQTISRLEEENSFLKESIQKALANFSLMPTTNHSSNAHSLGLWTDGCNILRRAIQSK